MAVRAEDEKSVFFGETFADEIQIREIETEDASNEANDESKQSKETDEAINYDEWETLISDMKS